MNVVEYEVRKLHVFFVFCFFFEFYGMYKVIMTYEISIPNLVV